MVRRITAHSNTVLKILFFFEVLYQIIINCVNALRYETNVAEVFDFPTGWQTILINLKI